MVTTASGQAFVAHAYDCFHAFHRAVNEAHDSQFGGDYKLRIRVSTYLCNRWVERAESEGARLPQPKFLCLSAPLHGSCGTAGARRVQSQVAAGAARAAEANAEDLDGVRPTLP